MNRLRPTHYLVLILVLALLSPIGSPVRTLLVGASQPVAAALYNIGFYTSPFRLDDNESSKRLDQLEADNARLRQENKSLRRQMNFVDSSTLNMVGADITGRSSDSISRDIRLNRGSKDGVQKGAAVVADGYLIGKVTNVFETSSVAKLVTDPDFRLTVLVGDNPTPGLARGAFGGVQVTRLPVTHPINDGDEVLSSDAGVEVPSGIPLGRVTGVKLKDSVFYEADLELPIYLESVQNVMVVLQ